MFVLSCHLDTGAAVFGELPEYGINRPVECCIIPSKPVFIRITAPVCIAEPGCPGALLEKNAHLSKNTLLDQ